MTLITLPGYECAPIALRLHMRHLLGLVVLGLVIPVTARAETSCTPAALNHAAETVSSLRHQLHTTSVPQHDPEVPSAIASQLAQLKSALTLAADAAFACAAPSATPEQIQATLADALHANLNAASETVLVTRNKKDQGAFGSDLAVQVFPLYNSPRFYEVDFRYGVECGDDNLLLVYRADPNASSNTAAWRQVLRWGAPTYNTVADAYGDFVLLTPLSGFANDRNWRFVVAHGQPGCTAASAPSRFDVDLLEPTSDPAHPTVVWHLDRPYLRSQVPRLLTTEDTLIFELQPPETTPGRHTKQTASAATSFRYRVSSDNHVEPLPATPDIATPPPSQAASTGSPH